MILLAIALAGASTPALAEERGFPAAGFDQVRAAGPFDVRIHVGGPYSVRATGPRAALDRLEVVTERGQLVIRAKRGDWSDWRSWFGRGERLVVNVSLPALNGVALLGSGDVGVDRSQGRAFAASLSGSGDLTVGELRADTAALDVSGSGSLTVAGRVGTAKASLRGSGDIRGGGLRADTATVALVGSGDVELAAQRAATISLTGSGDVTISGPARCTIAKRGSGEARCRG